MVCGWSCLAIAVARGLRGVFHAGTACLLVDAAIVVGCGLLTALFAPLLSGLNALLDALDGDAVHRFLAVAQGQLKLGCFSASGARGVDVAPSFGGACRGVGRHAERPRPRSAMSTTLGRSSRHSIGVEVVSPLSARLVVVRVLHASFGPRAFLPVLPACQGLVMRALLLQRSLGGREKFINGGGAVLVADGILLGLRRPVLNRTGLDWHRSGVTGHTPLAVRCRWRGSS
jgi:hypothetical protein